MNNLNDAVKEIKALTSEMDFVVNVSKIHNASVYVTIKQNTSDEDKLRIPTKYGTFAVVIGRSTIQ